jgi:hypothetical protein
LRRAVVHLALTDTKGIKAPPGLALSRLPPFRARILIKNVQFRCESHPARSLIGDPLDILRAAPIAALGGVSQPAA